MKDRLPDFARDALDPAGMAEVRDHIEGCSECRAELALILMLGTPAAVPAGLEDRVVMAVRARTARSGPGVRHYAVAASFVLALIAGSLFLRDRGPDVVASGEAGLASSQSAGWLDTHDPLLSGSAGLHSLSEEELEKLLKELES
jgi:anti-sigma factor RsiW